APRNSSVGLTADLPLAARRPVTLGEYPSPRAKHADRPRFAPAATLRAPSPGGASCAACGERHRDPGVMDIAIPATNTLVANRGSSPAKRFALLRSGRYRAPTGDARSAA